MPIRFLGESDIERKIEALGETFSPGAEEAFQAFEKVYLAAYEIIFDAIGKVASLKESGRRGDAEIQMSKWMEPSRLIGVAVAKKAALSPALLTAAREAVAQILPERFGIVLDHYPTLVYVFPDDETVVRPESTEEDLRALGLPLP
jgi:hypothetical protein